MTIEVQNIRKSFGRFVALDGVSIDIPTGQLVALLGPSGCGKTTLLRIIAGLDFADSGKIIVDGEDTSDKHVRQRQAQAVQFRVPGPDLGLDLRYLPAAAGQS